MSGFWDRSNIGRDIPIFAAALVGIGLAFGTLGGILLGRRWR